MKTYKLWIEIEEYDDETDEHTQPSQDGRCEPVPIGEVSARELEEAIELAQQISSFIDELTYFGQKLVRIKRDKLGDPIIPEDMIPPGE